MQRIGTDEHCTSSTNAWYFCSSVANPRHCKRKDTGSQDDAFSGGDAVDIDVSFKRRALKGRPRRMLLSCASSTIATASSSSSRYLAARHDSAVRNIFSCCQVRATASYAPVSIIIRIGVVIGISIIIGASGITIVRICETTTVDCGRLEHTDPPASETFYHTEVVVHPQNELKLSAAIVGFVA